MPRVVFDLIDGETVLDPEGSDCIDANDSRSATRIEVTVGEREVAVLTREGIAAA